MVDGGKVFVDGIVGDDRFGVRVGGDGGIPYFVAHLLFQDALIGKTDYRQER